MAGTLSGKGANLIYMKARHEFQNQQEYEIYLKMYFIGKIISNIKPKDFIEFEEQTAQSLDCVIVNFVEELIKVANL